MASRYRRQYAALIALAALAPASATADAQVPPPGEGPDPLEGIETAQDAVAGPAIPAGGGELVVLWRHITGLGEGALHITRVTPDRLTAARGPLVELTTEGQVAGTLAARLRHPAIILRDS